MDQTLHVDSCTMTSEGSTENRLSDVGIAKAEDVGIANTLRRTGSVAHSLRNFLLPGQTLTQVEVAMASAPSCSLFCSGMCKILSAHLIAHLCVSKPGHRVHQNVIARACLWSC